jgi:hypothetical protein
MEDAELAGREGSQEWKINGIAATILIERS